MSITDELREYTEEQIKWLDMTKVHYHKLFAIADRIDAEHERQLAEQFDSLTVDMQPMTDENMAENGWVRLPKDSDGEYIHIGDVMEWARYGDDDPTIVRTVTGVGFEVFFAWSDEQGRYAQYEARAYRHCHEQTVEDVLREMLTAAGCKLNEDGSCEMGLTDEQIAEYAAKLRLAEVEDA